MNSTHVSSLLARIPERVARVASGSAFLTHAAGCGEPERFAHLCKFLQWLTPLEYLSKDDQRLLGLLSGNARPAEAIDDAEFEMEEPVA
jgi:hypothetical protein